jgi:hypothetical protein
MTEEMTMPEFVDNSDYKVNATDFGSTIVRTDEDGKVWHIPTDPANSDYARYLRWVEAGNTARSEEHTSELQSP